MFKSESFRDDPIAKKSTLSCFGSLLILMFDKGRKGSDEGSIEIMLIRYDGSGEKVKLKIVHLFLV
jgi:hypothetical protein